MEPKQRKLLNTLFTSGTALVVFVLLDAVKLLVYFILDPTPRYVLELIFADNPAVGWIFIAFVGGVTLLDIAVSCFIGFSARSEAKGKKRNIFYVVVAIIWAIIVVCGSVFTLIDAFFEAPTISSIFDVVVSTAISAVVVYVLIDIVICSLKIRKINKENKNNNNESKEKDKEVLK